MLNGFKLTNKDGSIQRLETSQVKVLLLENVSQNAVNILKDCGFQV